MKPENDTDYQKFLKSQVRIKALRKLIAAARTYRNVSISAGEKRLDWPAAHMAKINLTNAAYEFAEVDPSVAEKSMKINLDKQTKPVLGSTTDAQSESRKPVWPEPGAPARAAKPPLGDIRPPADTCADSYPGSDFNSPADDLDYSKFDDCGLTGPAAFRLGGIGGFANKHVEATRKNPHVDNSRIRGIFDRILNGRPHPDISYHRKIVSVGCKSVSSETKNVKIFGWVGDIPYSIQSQWEAEAEAYYTRLTYHRVPDNGLVLYGSVESESDTGYLFFNETDICNDCTLLYCQ